MKKCFFLFLLIFVFFSAQAQTDGTLKVSATTSKTSTPTYNPRNIVAMWIEDSSGKFVKTLLAYASERKQHLKTWKAVTTVAGSAYNTVDAITGATQNSHATRTCTWNGKNRSSVLVADGTYKLRMEVTDNDGTVQNLATFTFTKGTSIQTLNPATTNGFSNISIEWIPLNTAIDEVEANSIYQLYPNPVTNKLFVSGDDIKKVDICDLDGKVLYSSGSQEIYLNFLPKGIYMVYIQTENKNIIRKFLKE
ncbi:MAG: DUF2271 domain-containing protein [Paludibacter sp.]|nr:DUF2271 domain-containing protein [Paludibacter sp.]